MPSPEGNRLDARSLNQQGVEGKAGITPETQVTPPQEHLQRALRERRAERAMSHQEVAERLRTTPEYISRIEKGEVDVSFSYLVKLAEALDAELEISFRPREDRGEQEMPQQDIPARQKPQ
jgi:ribosome-binding protein aMBF1 (putative translation factor)